jgi:hypothetical protein
MGDEATLIIRSEVQEKPRSGTTAPPPPAVQPPRPVEAPRPPERPERPQTAARPPAPTATQPQTPKAAAPERPTATLTTAAPVEQPTGTTATQPAATPVTQAIPNVVEIINKELGEQFRDASGAIDLTAFTVELRRRVSEAIDRGAKAFHVVHEPYTDKEKRVEIDSTGKDKAGQYWGTFDILASKSGKERVEIERPATVTRPQQQTARQPPTTPAAQASPAQTAAESVPLAANDMSWEEFERLHPPESGSPRARALARRAEETAVQERQTATAAEATQLPSVTAAPTAAQPMRQEIEFLANQKKELEQNLVYLRGDEAHQRQQRIQELTTATEQLYRQQTLLTQASQTYYSESAAGQDALLRKMRDQAAQRQLEQRDQLAQLRAREEFYRTPQGQQAARVERQQGEEVKQAEFQAQWSQLVAERGKTGAAMEMLGQHVNKLSVILPGPIGGIIASVGQLSGAVQMLSQVGRALFAPERPASQAVPEPERVPVERPASQTAQAPAEAAAPANRLPTATRPMPTAEAPPPTVRPVVRTTTVSAEEARGLPVATKAPTVAAPEAAGAAEVAAGAEGAAAGLGGAAAAAGPIGIAVEVAVKAMQELQKGVSGAVHGLGNFAVELANPDANPAKLVGAAGQAVEGFGEKVMVVSPALGILSTVAGAGATEMSRFMAMLNESAERLGQYNAAIATAQGQAEARQIQGDTARGQQLEANLSKFLDAQSKAEQDWADIKAAITNKLIPLATGTFEVLDGLLKVVKGVLKVSIENPFAGSGNDPADQALRQIFLGGERIP